jgi:hypothetical protein
MSNRKSLTPLLSLSSKEEDRFWRKVSIVPDGCWNWTASFYPTGYGQFGLRIQGKNSTHTASRIAYVSAIGNPGDSLVCHICDNRACCRPSHLFLGSHYDNNRDMYEKGRHPVPAYADACVNGHLYIEENSYLRTSSENSRRNARVQRFCRTCNRLSKHERWELSGGGGSLMTEVQDTFPDMTLYEL